METKGRATKLRLLKVKGKKLFGHAQSRILWNTALSWGEWLDHRFIFQSTQPIVALRIPFKMNFNLFQQKLTTKIPIKSGFGHVQGNKNSQKSAENKQPFLSSSFQISDYISQVSWKCIYYFHEWKWTLSTKKWSIIINCCHQKFKHAMYHTDLQLFWRIKKKQTKVVDFNEGNSTRWQIML